MSGAKDLLFHPVAAQTIAYDQGLDLRNFRRDNIPVTQP